MVIQLAKSANQKLKLLYIIKILSEKTDEEHSISTQNLIAELEKYEISAERKSIYDDIQQLQQFGYDIVSSKSKNAGGYYLASREFELPELKLLVDAVQSSKFITIRKSKELIKKLESFASVYEGKQLQRQVFVSNRVKTENEKIYYNVDEIHRGIQLNRKISFQYFEWNIEKKMQFRKEGERYQVSPWALIWRDENYYLVAFDEKDSKIKHYRVDKMNEISQEEKEREGLEHFEQFNIAEYANKTFGMYGGREEIVTLQFSNALVGVVLDRFGKDIDIRKRDESHFSVRVKVALSGQFYGWITGIGPEAKIIAPVGVVEEYKKYLEDILKTLF